MLDVRCSAAGATKPRFPRATALAVTRELLARIDGTTDRLLVAGSLRRRKPEVGDVEFVIIPRVEERPDPGDLFGAKRPFDLAACAIEEMLRDGTLRPRPKCDETLTWGEQIKLATHVAIGLGIDFFLTDPARFWNLVVCRTGPKELNIEICNRARTMGWQWKPYGEGFLRESPIHATPARPPEIRTMHSEEEVFRFVGLPYLQPADRTLENVRRAIHASAD